MHTVLSRSCMYIYKHRESMPNSRWFMSTSGSLGLAAKSLMRLFCCPPGYAQRLHSPSPAAAEAAPTDISRLTASQLRIFTASHLHSFVGPTPTSAATPAGGCVKLGCPTWTAVDRLRPASRSSLHGCWQWEASPSQPLRLRRRVLPRCMCSIATRFQTIVALGAFNNVSA